MRYLVFDIPEGTIIREFLTGISGGYKLSPYSILVIVRESQSSSDYYIKTYSVHGKEGKIFLGDLNDQDVEDIFNGDQIVKQGNIINSESMIFKHKS